MSIEQDVKEVIAHTLSLTPDEVSMDQSLTQALDVDSTEMVDLRVALEKKFGVKIAANEVTKNSLPKDIVALLEAKKVGV